MRLGDYWIDKDPTYAGAVAALGPSASCRLVKNRFLGVRDIAFVLRTELDELIERLSYEKDRLEKDEAIYGLTDCDAEMKFYGREVTRVIGVLRGALKELRHLREDYRVKN